MLKRMTILLVTIFMAGGLLLTTTQTAAANSSGNGGGNGYGNSGTGSACIGTTCTNTSLSFSTAPLSATEKDSLLFMVEEEKLARDVYQFLAAKWNLVVFSNIAQSEQMHMDSVLTLIDRYDLTSPVSSQAGVFANSDLQALYTQLTEKGSQSLAEALRVGGAIEEIDIRDLQSRSADVTHSDITRVFNNLLSGSYNHLRAFANEYELETGTVYAPQYLDSLDFQEAIESVNTRGGSTSTQGMGTGQYGRR